MSDGSPIIEFANVLHAHGVGSAEAEAFKARFASDRTFCERAEVLERLFGDRARVLHALESTDVGPSKTKRTSGGRRAAPANG